MNVLHLDEQTGWRGGEQQASWLIQGLVRHGHRVFISGKAAGEFLRAPHGGIEVTRIPLPFLSEFDLYTAWRLSRVILSQKIDIVHAHSSHAHGMAILARRFAGCGKVVVSRRVSFEPKPNRLNRWKYLEPDMLVAVSGKVAEVLRDYGIPENKRTVVYSSVDLGRLDVPPLPRTELGIPADAPLLVSAGALVGHKDHETLINAFPRVLEAFPDARLLIAGEGELRSSIENLLTSLGLTNAITLLGHRKDVPRLTRAADLYVSSSWSEGLGTSVLEALACATPVVATVAGGVPEMVLPGQTGYLVPNRNPQALAEAILASLTHREQAREMARKGRALVEERFTPDKMVQGTLAVYERLLAS